MARARNIKPSFFANDDLADINPLGRLLFIGLWTLADREGRLEDRPRRIKAEVLPYDNCDVDGLLDDLEQHGFILRYVVNEERFIQVVNFAKHQNPHVKESASSIPAPTEEAGSTVQAQCKAQPEPEQAGLIPDSGFPLTDSGYQREDGPPAVQADPTPSKAKTPRATRLATDWQLPAEWEEWALTEHPSWTREGVRHVADRFKDHWLAQGGANARKVDWQATWRNWVRREKTPGPGFAPSRTSPAPMNRQEALEARNREVAAQLARTL